MIALLVAVAAATATYSGPAIATFHWQLTPTFVSRLEAVVGYPCTEYVEPRGLLIFITPALNKTIYNAFPHSLAGIEPLDTQSRCAPTIATFGQRNEFAVAGHGPKTRAFLNGTLETVGSTATVGVPVVASLQVFLHQGALEGVAAQEMQADATYWFIAVQSEVASLNVDGMTVERITDAIMQIHGVPTELMNNVTMHIAGLMCVCYVEPVYPAMLLNLWSAGTTQSLSNMPADTIANAVSCYDSAACAPLWNAGITGAGQLIAVSDTGAAAATCMFVDGAHGIPFSSSFSSIPADTGHRKFRVYWSGSGGDFGDGDGHGTHVCGTAAGHPASAGSVSASGLRAEQFSGVAPDARLVFIDVQTGSGGLVIPSPYDTNLLQYAYNAGARIHTGSWGIADFSYSSEDRSVDLFAWHHRTFIAVFAAGNSGDSVGASSILSPALAKNAIAVGAGLPGFTAFDMASGSFPTFSADAYAYDWVADFSSRGGSTLSVPWMKPNMLGSGGLYVWSANANGISGATCSGIGDVIVGMAGTSMASPQIAGAAALIRQYFIGTVGYEPMASLVKAVLAASAMPTRGVFPQLPMSSFSSSPTYAPYGRSYLEGHGRISLDRVIFPSGQKPAVLSNEGTALQFHNDMRRYCIAISAGTPVAVSIVLSWTDYPTSVASAAALVNDLDLRIVVRNAVTGAFVQEYAHPNGLSTRDGRSTMEVIRIAAFDATAYRLQVEVSAWAISYAEQSFSLLLAVHDPTRQVRVNGNLLTTPDGSIADSSTTGSCYACETGIFTYNTCTTPAPAPTPKPPTLPPPTPKPLTLPPPTPKPPTLPPPTPKPTPKPTLPPTPKPTLKPTPKPTSKPTPKPTSKPTPKPTLKPTPKPTSKPTPPPLSNAGNRQTIGTIAAMAFFMRI